MKKTWDISGYFVELCQEMLYNILSIGTIYRLENRGAP